MIFIHFCSRLVNSNAESTQNEVINHSHEVLIFIWSQKLLVMICRDCMLDYLFF